MNKKVNKKSLKVLVNTFLVLGVIQFTVIPESHSKYFDNKDIAFSYQADLYSLYKGNIIRNEINKKENVDISTMYTSSYQTIYLQVDFTRNQNIIDDETIYQDTFLFTKVPDGCSVITINNKKTSASISIPSSNTNEEVTATIKCPVVEKDGKIQVEFPILEYVNDEKSSSFTIWDVTFEINADRYFEIYPKPPVPPTPEEPVPERKDRKIIIPKDYTGDKEEIFKTLLIDYLEDYQTSHPNEAIISSILVSLDNIAKYATNVYEVDKELQIDGLVGECDETQCVYTIQDNFIGYAKTEATKINATNTFYFSDVEDLGIDGPEKLNAILYNYLEKYLYPDNKNDLDLVYNYILAKSEDDIRNIFDGNIPNFAEFIYRENERMFTIGSDILSVAKLFFSKGIQIDYDTEESMRNQLRTGIYDLQSDLNLTQLECYYLNQRLVANTDFMTLLYKTNIEIPNETILNNIFSIQLDSRTFIVSITSTGVDYNFVSIVESFDDETTGSDEDNTSGTIKDPIEEDKDIDDTDSDEEKEETNTENQVSIEEEIDNTIIELKYDETVNVDEIIDIVFLKDKKDNSYTVTIQVTNCENIVGIAKAIDEYFNLEVPTVIPASSYIAKEDKTYEAVYTIKVK